MQSRKRNPKEDGGIYLEGDTQQDYNSGDTKKNSNSIWIIVCLVLIICTLAVFRSNQRSNFAVQDSTPPVGVSDTKSAHEYVVVLPGDKLRGKSLMVSEPEKQNEAIKLDSVTNTPAVKPVDAGPNLASVERKMIDMIEELRNMKFVQDVIMETDPTAQTKIKETQEVIREFLVQKYGPGPYRVEMKIQFPASMPPPTPLTPGQADEATIVIELAPIEYVPYSVYFFLENIVSVFKSGAFHRNAGHVLQAMIHSRQPTDSESLMHGRQNFAWQEYSPQYPHKKFTLGYAGRPSGNSAIYISTVDNTRNHGPASQGSKTEADRWAI